EPQHSREDEHQHEIKRQHINIGWQEAELQRLDQDHVRLLKEFENAEFFRIERILETARYVDDLREVKDQQKYECDIDLPGAFEDACSADDEATLAHDAAIDEGGCVPRYENEDFRSVAEAEIPYREPGDEVRRHMVEKNE